MKIKDVPIVHIKDNLYLIGLYKVVVDLQADYLMVKVSQDHWQRFSEYLKSKRELFLRCLTLLSLRNENLPVVEIVNRLIVQDYMDGLQNSYMTSMSFARN